MNLNEIKVHKKPGGPYYTRPYLGLDVNKKQIRPYKEFPEARSEAEALAMAREWVSGYSVAAGMHVGNTVSALARQYVRFKMALGEWAEATARAYDSLIRCYVDPMFGRMAPGDLMPYMVEALYIDMLVDGACGRGKVGKSQVRKLHGFMSGFYKWLHSEHISEINMMASVMAPKRDASTGISLDGSQTKALLDELDGIISDCDAPAFKRGAAMAAETSLWNGLRPGESLSINRSDVDLERKILRICSTAVPAKGGVKRQDKTKGKKSRNLQMDAQFCDRVALQYAWQQQVFGDRSRERDFPLCCGDRGQMLRPDSVSRWFKDTCRRLGLPEDAHNHTLRHTHASVLVAEGTDIRTVAERLGHAKHTLTLETYSHLMPGRDQAAAETFAGFIGRIEAA